MKRLLTLFLLLFSSALALSACALPTTPPHTHAWGEWRVTREATCALEGEKQRVCECSEVETARIAKEMHVRDGGTITLQPTCTTEGRMVIRCTECAAEIISSPVDKLPHDYELISTTEPTCTAVGYSCYECRECGFEHEDDFVPANGHKLTGAVYNGDATGSKNGTATGFCTVCKTDGAVAEIHGSSDLIRAIFGGKKVSVMGDSISTYVNVSGGDAAKTTNSTIKSNSAYYNGVHNELLLDNDVNKTWWMRTINHLGADLLVNNSDSGGFILDFKANGNAPAYMRADQLHDDTGDDAGTEPDMIFIYLGTNDFARYGKNAAFGDVGSVDFDSLEDMCSPDYRAKSVAEAYAILLYKLTRTYENAEIYCLDLIEATSWHTNGRDQTIDDFNAMIAALCQRFGAHFVDIYTKSGITLENLNDYVPVYDGDDTDNLYHPNAAGFELISNVLLEVIIENTEDYPTFEDFSALIKEE